MLDDYKTSKYYIQPIIASAEVQGRDYCRGQNNMLVTIAKISDTLKIMKKKSLKHIY